MNATPFYIECLRGELLRRCKKNPTYSLRALARATRIDVAGLSRVLAGKTSLSSKTAQKLLEHLDLDSYQRMRFIESMEEIRKQKRIRETSTSSSLPIEAEQASLSLAHFQVIANWYHYAVLELTHISAFRPEIKWIANELGVSEIEIKEAIKNLRALGLLKCKGKKWIDTQANLGTSQKHITTPALRRRQKQILEKALASLDLDPIDKRNHTATTMAIDPTLLPEAKKRIAAFQKELTTFLEGGIKKQVYELGVFLIPLQKGQKI